MSAAPVDVMAAVLDSPTGDFTYQLWTGEIALTTYHDPGPGGDAALFGCYGCASATAPGWSVREQNPN